MNNPVDVSFKNNNCYPLRIMPINCMLPSDKM